MKNNNYSLSIRNGKNSFSPIEWSKLAINNVENANPYSLEDIDKFTSQITIKELLDDLLEENYLSEEDYMTSLEIIYYEKGNNRTLPEGPCFIEDSEFLNPDNIVNFIIDNITDLQLINKIYNYLNKYKTEDDIKYLKFVKLLNYTREIVKENNEEKLRAICSLIRDYFNSLSYLERRRTGMYISKKLIPKKELNDSKILIYNNEEK